MWPSPADGNVVITPAQPDMLLEGIDWRMGRGACNPKLRKGCARIRSDRGLEVDEAEASGDDHRISDGERSRSTFRRGVRMGVSPARIGGLICVAYALFALTGSRAAGPPLWDPPAIDVFPEHDSVLTGKQTLEDFAADGHRLFVTRFNVLDGAGRPTATGDSKPTIRNRVDKLFQRVAGRTQTLVQAAITSRSLVVVAISPPTSS